MVHTFDVSRILPEGYPEILPRESRAEFFGAGWGMSPEILGIVNVRVILEESPKS